VLLIGGGMMTGQICVIRKMQFVIDTPEHRGRWMVFLEEGYCVTLKEVVEIEA
jgi:hypothetical protein